MSTTGFDRVYEIFSTALGLPAAEREAYLDRVCRGEAELRREVETLLESHRRAAARDFLEPDAPDCQDEPRDDPLVGLCVGHYQVQARIGVGGMGRIDEAAPLLETSRKIVAGNPDATDVDIARNLRSLGWLRFMQGRYLEAEAPARKVLAMYRAKLGEFADETLQSKLHLAMLLANMEVRHNEAESLIREVIQARRKSLGAEDPEVGFALLVQILVHASAHQEERAFVPGVEAARIFAAHPETNELAQGITGIANSVVPMRVGNKQAAVDLARHSLDQIREFLGKDHPIVEFQILFTRRLLEEMGDSEQAEKLYREAIDELRSRGLEQSYLHARNLERLGLIAQRSNRYDEADAHLREALAIYRRSLGNDSWRVGWTLAHVGINQTPRGKYEDAVSMLDEAMRIFERVAADSPLDSVGWCQRHLRDATRKLAAAEH